MNVVVWIGFGVAIIDLALIGWAVWYTHRKPKTGRLRRHYQKD